MTYNLQKRTQKTQTNLVDAKDVRKTIRNTLHKFSLNIQIPGCSTVIMLQWQTKLISSKDSY